LWYVGRFKGLTFEHFRNGIGYNFPYFKELLDNPVGKVCCPEWICFWAAFIKDSVSNILG
jgi:hypothetical protein